VLHRDSFDRDTASTTAGTSDSGTTYTYSPTSLPPITCAEIAGPPFTRGVLSVGFSGASQTRVAYNGSVSQRRGSGAPRSPPAGRSTPPTPWARRRPEGSPSDRSWVPAPRPSPPSASTTGRCSTSEADQWLG
jgi:hypothetical protein